MVQHTQQHLTDDKKKKIAPVKKAWGKEKKVV